MRNVFSTVSDGSKYNATRCSLSVQEKIVVNVFDFRHPKRHHGRPRGSAWRSCLCRSCPLSQSPQRKSHSTGPPSRSPGTHSRCRETCAGSQTHTAGAFLARCCPPLTLRRLKRDSWPKKAKKILCLMCTSFGV